MIDSIIIKLLFLIVFENSLQSYSFKTENGQTGHHLIHY
jgi:hypothetical protein